MITISKPIIGPEELNAVTRILSSGALASGNEVSAFENAFASYLGVKEAVATTSGTTALEVALKACGIGPGDKVVTTPFSFIASTNAIIYAGALPVFADIDERSFNISPSSIEAILNNERAVKAVLVVHLFGQSCDMEAITDICQQHRLILIEDCAQAHGAKWGDRLAGSFGDAAAFSFYPTKNMTTGEGGMVVTGKQDVARNARLLINHGMRIRYHHDIIGHNYRMTNLAAAIGLEQLRKLDRFNQARNINAAFYNQYLNHPAITKPFVSPQAHHVFHQYTLRISGGGRTGLINHLEKAGIGYGIYYPGLIPEQPCYKECNFPLDFKYGNSVKEEVISIPVHPSLTMDELEQIVQTINSFGG